MSQHTKEPWKIEQSKHGLLGIYGNGESKAVCGTIRKEVRDKTNLARIVAAVNAVAGIPTEELTRLGLGGLAKMYVDNTPHTT